MKKLSIYLDTSIFNFALDENNPKERNLTLKLFENVKKGEYEAFISEIVTTEIDKAPEKIAVKLRSVVNEIEPEELPITEEVKLLSEKYIEQGIIPEKYRNDALHIAIASCNDLDVVVSWNFEHIVKVKTKREVTGVNALMGYKEIEIYSPLEVVEDV